jgi:hypothetical protein
MAMTFLCVHATQGDDKSTLRLFISNEYTPHKDRDADGKVLPNQEWQHPDPLTLRYTEMGVGLSGPGSHFTSIVQTMMQHGVKCFGGHARLITEGAEDILNGRQQSWEEKLAEDQASREAWEAERLQEMWAEEQKRAPVYEYCSRCGEEREACKNLFHRGERRCMSCCGGVSDTHNRYCVNCLDLPYRELREKALGTVIVYSGESESDD